MAMMRLDGPLVFNSVFHPVIVNRNSKANLEAYFTTAQNIMPPICTPSHSVVIHDVPQCGQPVQGGRNYPNKI